MKKYVSQVFIADLKGCIKKIFNTLLNLQSKQPSKCTQLPYQQQLKE
jgi:hypothetical protein